MSESCGQSREDMGCWKWGKAEENPCGGGESFGIGAGPVAAVRSSSTGHHSAHSGLVQRPLCRGEG